MEALRTALTSSDSFEWPRIAMIYLRGASGDPESPEGRARSPSGHRESLTTRKERGERRKGDRYAIGVRNVINLPPGAKRLPKGVGTTVAEEFEAS